MPEAKQGDTVRIHYTGKLDDGTVFDSSTGREPLEFTIGKEEVIPGFEKAVLGMEPGQTRTTTIVPEMTTVAAVTTLAATTRATQPWFWQLWIAAICPPSRTMWLTISRQSAS